MDNQQMEKRKDKVYLGYWDKYDADHTIRRFVTSWATRNENVNDLISLL